MSLEVTGKLVAKLDQQTGQGRNGAWVRQDFIIETEAQFPKKICLSAWGDKTRDFAAVNMGETVKVSIDIESREYNGRWYTDIRPWKVERLSQSSSAASPFVPPVDNEVPPAPPINLEASSDESDLPF